MVSLLSSLATNMLCAAAELLKKSYSMGMFCCSQLKMLKTSTLESTNKIKNETSKAIKPPVYIFLINT